MVFKGVPGNQYMKCKYIKMAEIYSVVVWGFGGIRAISGSNVCQKG